MLKIHQFDPEIYPRKLWIIFSNNPNLKNDFLDRNNNDLVLDTSNCYAITIRVKEKKSKLLGELVIFESKEKCTPKNMAHEAAHVVSDIWADLGEDEPGEEANAYLVGWVVDCMNTAKNFKKIC